MLDFSNLLISLIDVTPDLVKSIFNYIFIGIIVLRKWKPNPLWVMAGSGFAGIILYSLV